MIAERVSALRKLMAQNGIDAYLVPSVDAHRSEYVPDAWKRRAWISGFTGSAGDVVVTAEKAGLWADSRYYLQAEKELAGSGFVLFKKGLPGVPDYPDWLAAELTQGQAVGADPALIGIADSDSLQATLKNRGLRLTWLEQNLVDSIWSDRPSLPTGKVAVHAPAYSGEKFPKKLDRLRQELEREAVDCLVITTLDDIAWLFNIRGEHVPYNPVALAYAAVTGRTAELFIDSSKPDEAVIEHLGDAVRLRPYEDFEGYITKLAESQGKVWLDPGSANRRVYNRLEGACRIHRKSSPLTLFKACKNDTEVEGFRSAHVRDGVAMTKFLFWLQNTAPRGGITEMSAAARLAAFRREQDLFQQPSFSTIAAFGAHAAIVHYGSSPETDCQVGPKGLFLVDSGGQYLDGTTDITRTVAIGPPTAEQRERFTQVLRGHIDLSTTVFPEGTKGAQLDALAKKPLWDAGLTYGHGTGHGIGSYLCVHEGPQAISAVSGMETPLMPGMFISLEPGFYKAGEYGIRIENLAVIVKDENLSTGDLDYLGFDTVTLCPIDLALVEADRLSDGQLAYLNDYHARVLDALSPLLAGAEVDFLTRCTRSI